MLKEFCDCCGKDMTDDLVKATISLDKNDSRYKEYTNFRFCEQCLRKIDNYIRSNLQNHSEVQSG